MSLRTRVALLTTVVAVGLAFASGAFVIARFRVAEERRIDAQLSDQWRDLSQASVSVLQSNRPAAHQLLDMGLQAPLSVRVVDGDEALLSLGGGPVGGFNAAAPLGFSTVDLGGQRWRVLSGPISPRARPAVSFEVQFASPLDSIDAAVDVLRRQVVWIGGALVIVAGVLGWVIGGVALRPISRLRRRATEVAETTNLSLRLDPDQGAEEVNELARDLNVMLDRIAEADRERAHALDAARAFSAAAAHELRTPLTSMQANIDVLHNLDILDDGDRKALVDDLSSQQQRIRDLLEALRMLSRGDLAEANTFEDVDLIDLVELAVGDARRRHPDVEFATHIDKGVTSIRAWPEGLRVMVDNMLANAVSHGRPTTGRAWVAVALRDRNGRVELSVGDNGPGVPLEERAAVLDRFRRGHSAAGSGSGLGLSLVQQQAELHGGSVAIGESLWGGDEVRVCLAGRIEWAASEVTHHPQRSHKLRGDRDGDGTDQTKEVAPCESVA